MTTDINIYNVYGYCYDTTPPSSNEEAFEMYQAESQVGFQVVDGELRTYKKYATPQDYTPWAFPSFAQDRTLLRDLPPCTFGYPLIEYLNRADVKESLHIPSYVQAWDLCTSEISYTELEQASQWIYEKLGKKYRKLIYSGDCDGAVPTEGTLNWINSLNYTVTSEW